MSDKKKYIITSLTLGLIAAFSACVIGLTNLLTVKKIDKNNEEKIHEGLVEIFGEDFKLADGEDLSGYEYTNYVYVINDSYDHLMGYAFKTSGSNMYGKISMIVGFTAEDNKFIKLSLVTNEQTYASTLVDKYVDPVNNGDRSITDVDCGATYGAKLIRDMVNDAKKAAGEMHHE